MTREGGKTNTRKFTHHIFLAANSSETVLTASKNGLSEQLRSHLTHCGVLNDKVEQIRYRPIGLLSRKPLCASCVLKELCLFLTILWQSDEGGNVKQEILFVLPNYYRPVFIFKYITRV